MLSVKEARLLATLLSEGSDMDKTNVALRFLAFNAANQVTIAAAGAIPPLVALLLSEGSDSGKENAAAALRNLAFNAAN